MIPEPVPNSIHFEYSLIEEDNKIESILTRKPFLGWNIDMLPSKILFFDTSNSLFDTNHHLDSS